jgi:hypothetical protein
VKKLNNDQKSYAILNGGMIRPVSATQSIKSKLQCILWGLGAEQSDASKLGDMLKVGKI